MFAPVSYQSLLPKYFSPLAAVIIQSGDHIYLTSAGVMFENRFLRVFGRRGRWMHFEDIVEIRMLLDGVDSDRREALLLTQVLGLSYAEAAEICGCPVGTIRSRVARARDDLLRAGNQDQSAG